MPPHLPTHQAKNKPTTAAPERISLSLSHSRTHARTQQAVFPIATESRELLSEQFEPLMLWSHGEHEKKCGRIKEYCVFQHFWFVKVNL